MLAACLDDTPSTVAASNQQSGIVSTADVTGKGRLASARKPHLHGRSPERAVSLAQAGQPTRSYVIAITPPSVGPDANVRVLCPRDRYVSRTVTDS